MASYADDLKKTVAQSGGSMKSLIPAPAKTPTIEPVKADASANVSGQIDTVFSAKNDLPFAKEVTPEQTVAGQMRELLDSDSPYLAQARESGLRYSASRGMLDSSLAAGHAEQAAIAAALPIASQDASAFERAARDYQAHLETLIQQANAGDINAQLQLQNAGYNSQLSAQEHTQRLREAAEQGDISARLQLQAGLQSSVLQRQQGDINSRLQREQGDINSRLQKEQGQIQARLDQARFAHDKVMQQLAQAGQLELQNRDFQNQQSILGQQFAHALQMDDRQAAQWVSQQNMLHQQTLEQIDVQARASMRADAQQQSAAIQGQFLGQVSQLQIATNQELTAIYSTQGLTGAQQQTAAQNAINRYNANVTALRSQYETSPLWHDDFGNPSKPAQTLRTPPATEQPPRSPVPTTATAAVRPTLRPTPRPVQAGGTYTR